MSARYKNVGIKTHDVARIITNIHVYVLKTAIKAKYCQHRNDTRKILQYTSDIRDQETNLRRNKPKETQ